MLRNQVNSRGQAPTALAGQDALNEEKETWPRWGFGAVAGRVGRQRGLGPGPCLSEEEILPLHPHEEIVMMVRALHFLVVCFSIIETYTFPCRPFPCRLVN